MTKLIAALLLPPLNLLLLALAALFLRPRWPRLGANLLLFTLASGYVLCSSVATGNLLRLLERAAPAFDPTDKTAITRDATAIVVLGGGSYSNAPEYGGDTVGAHTLERLRWAARLQRSLQLPLLVSGGNPLGNTTTEAAQMRAVLVEDFNVPVRWMEAQSANTYESALKVFDMLHPESVSRVVLVTHAVHMRRAILVFEHAGFQVTPAPTGFTTRSPPDIVAFLPSAKGLEMARTFFHEIVGISWYHLRLAHAA